MNIVKGLGIVLLVGLAVVAGFAFLTYFYDCNLAASCVPKKIPGF